MNDDLKFGVEELLLGDKEINKCGIKMTGLKANHLGVKAVGVQNLTPLVQYIDDRISAYINLRHNTAPVVALNSRPIPIIYQG